MHLQQQQQQQQFVITAGGDKSVKLWNLLQQLPQQPSIKSTVIDANPVAVTSTDAAAAADVGDAVAMPPPEVQLAAAAAVRQPSAGGGSWQQGKHSSTYYAAVALVPGSVMSDGSCMMLMTGMAGGVMLAALVPGKQSHKFGWTLFVACPPFLCCRWRAYVKKRHHGGRTTRCC
jgi:hypothetical protein